MLCMTEKPLNSLVKQPPGAPANMFLFGNLMHEPSIVEELYQAHNNATPVSIRTYVDKFMQRELQETSRA